MIRGVVPVVEDRLQIDRQAVPVTEHERVIGSGAAVKEAAI